MDEPLPAPAAVISQVPAELVPPAGRDDPPRTLLLDRLLDLGIYLALAVLVVYFSFASEFFLTQSNLINIAQAIALTGLLAAAFTVALIAGQLDLSVGSTLGLGSVVCAVALAAGWPTWAAALAAVAAALIVGLANGLLVVNLGINSIIATLAMGLTVRGVALIITDGQNELVTNPALQDAVNARPLGLPLPFLLMAAVYAMTYVVLVHTRAGYHVYATGGNESAATRAGVRVRVLYRWVFLATAATAGIAGVLTTGQTAAGGPAYGNGIEFDVLTAVLLGGIGLAGGSGRIQRTLAGVLLVGVLNNGLTLVDVDAYYQQLARGAVFVLAVILAATSEKRRRR